MTELFGTAAAAAMVVCYAFDDRGPAYVMGFAASCAAAAGYALAIGSRPFFAIESVWAVLAARPALRRLGFFEAPDCARQERNRHARDSQRSEARPG